MWGKPPTPIYSTFGICVFSSHANTKACTHTCKLAFTLPAGIRSHERHYATVKVVLTLPSPCDVVRHYATVKVVLAFHPPCDACKPQTV